MRASFYFAYGSNLCLSRIRRRAPSSLSIAVGCLPGYRLEFHKRSIDGSGKGTILFDGDDDHIVFGALYLMDPDEKAALDEVEGEGYRIGVIEVTTPQGPMEATTYIARDSFVDETLLPYRWYLDYVIDGARRHGLPEYYLASLERVACVQDPDALRAGKNRDLLLDGRRYAAAS